MPVRDRSTQRLILVKHAMPTIQPDMTPSQWPLSEDGRQSCAWLAQKLAEWQPARIIASQEPKAQASAQIAAAQLGLPLDTWPDLHEHMRQAGNYTSQEKFHASMARFFAAPNQLIFGLETAHQAQMRFSAAIQRLLQAHPDQTLAVVAHGTVITLFTAQTNPIEPFSFWQSLTLPALVVVSLPDCKLITEPILFN